MIYIAVIDYGMGNLRSVSKALEHVAPSVSVVVTSDPHEVIKAGRIVFPGQGAMPDCMREMESRGLREAILESAKTKPFLGICIGMQMLFDRSEEGDTAGLGIFRGTVKRFRPADHALKVPHMGWNEVTQTAQHSLWQDISSGERFYYVHSYYCEPFDPVVTTATTDYSGHFTAAIARANIFATQFHPEKSHRAGLALYRNFLNWHP